MKKKYSTLLFVFVLQLFFFNVLKSQPVIQYEPVISGLSSPVDVVNADDNTNRIFIVQQGGLIKVYSSTHVFLADFLTVTGIASSGEQGLLSLAFHPDYENNGFFWVYYTNSSGDLEVARYHVSANPNQADAASKQIVITIPHPVNSNHNGAKLNFGPDGYLYFATGDGGGAGDVPNNAQNGNVLLGKMLRIDVATTAGGPFYTIPPDNPFVGNPAILDEIFALGLRNPFRWSFDRSTGGMWIGDVGQGLREEINYRAAGTTAAVNYGWRCYEGNLPYNTSGCAAQANYVFPVYEYSHTGSSASVTGGFVYRGSKYLLMQGYYFAADVYSGNLYVLNTTDTTVTVQSGLPNLVVGFGESESGELYAASLNGTLYNMQSFAVLPAKLLYFDGLARNGTNILSWKTAFEQDLKHFELEFSYDAVNFVQVGIIPAKNDVNGSVYSYEHRPVSFAENVYYRLKSVDKDNKFSWSDIKNLHSSGDNKLFVFPSPVKGNNISIYVTEPYSVVQIINSNGSVVYRQQLNGQTGRIQLPAQNLNSGIYYVRLYNRISSISQKIMVER